MKRLVDLFLLFSCATGFIACGGVKLTDVVSSTAVLKLSTEQQEFIEPKIGFIGDIVEDYDFEKEEFKVFYERYRTKSSLPRLRRYEGGGRIARRQRFREQNELRTTIKSFVKQRQKYVKEIGDLLNQIRENLTPYQLGLFREIALPKLRLPEMLRSRSYTNFMFVPGVQRPARNDF